MGDSVRIRVVTLVGLLGLVACAGSGASPPSYVGDRVAGPRSEGVRWVTDEQEVQDTIAAPLDQVVEAIPGVLEFLGLPVEQRGPRIFETPSYRIRDRLYEDVPNSAYFDCGMGQTGARADSYEIHFTLLAEVRPIGTRTTVLETLVSGRASDRFHNTEPVPCWGTGRLEGEFATLLRRQVGAGRDGEASATRDSAR